MKKPSYTQVYKVCIDTVYIVCLHITRVYYNQYTRYIHLRIAGFFMVTVSRPRPRERTLDLDNYYTHSHIPQVLIIIGYRIPSTCILPFFFHLWKSNYTHEQSIRVQQ